MKISMMESEEEWTVVFYQLADGESPVETFLDLTRRRRRASSGPSNRCVCATSRPVNRWSSIWKAGSGSCGARATPTLFLLYAILPGRRIVLLHGFQKKTQKTPRREIEVAQQQRLEDLIRREGDNLR